jgi:hypothetical protein
LLAIRLVCSVPKRLATPLCVYAERPKLGSFGFAQRMIGGIKAAIAAFTKSIGSVAPVEYTATTAATTERKYDDQDCFVLYGFI